MPWNFLDIDTVRFLPLVIQARRTHASRCTAIPSERARKTSKIKRTHNKHRCKEIFPAATDAQAQALYWAMFRFNFQKAMMKQANHAPIGAAARGSAQGRKMLEIKCVHFI
jgi:hypothetical protein